MVRFMTREYLPEADELSRDPEKYLEIFQDRLHEAIEAAHEARTVINEARYAMRQRDRLRGYRANGVKKQPKPQHEEADEGAEQVPVTRKPQVAALLGQDPNRYWSNREIGEALGIENLKSLWVTLEEMVKAGSLIKSSDSRYALAPGQDVP